MNNLDQAREWAAEITESRQTNIRPDAFAAAEVIQSLPDQWADAEKLREALEGWEIAGKALRETDLGKRLEALIPAPAPRTLADMSFEELKDYIEEKVTVEGWANPSMLVAVIGDEGAVLAHRWNVPWPFVEVRPLSDLTPIAAPEQEAENTSEPVQPRPEDVPPGEPWLVKCDGYEWVGTRDSRVETVCSWTLARLDGADYTVARDAEITLVSRLVPEVKP